MSHKDPSDNIETGLLLAYCDGALDAKTRQRIEQALARSPALQEELVQLTRMQARLAQSLSQATAPTQLELGEYALGIAGPDEVARIERQIAAYPHLAREVAALRAYLFDQDPPAVGVAPNAQSIPLRERIRLVVARLVEDISGAGGAPLALAGVRGVQVGEQVYAMDDGQLIVATQENQEQPHTRDILGLAIGLAADYEYWVSLYQAEQLWASATMDAYGNFVISGIRPDVYCLVLSSVATEIVVPALAVE